uniref:Uncharacterized protein n=1 Tax=Romanomermis culicivorax TaxID=13658 RepID=A0A915HS64_ROMCU
MSNQELATQLCELKGTLEALFDIIMNAATEDNNNEFLELKMQKELQKQYQQMQQFQQQAALQQF